MSFGRCASLVLALAVSACASSGETSSGAGGQTAARAARGNSTLITPAELEQHQGESAYRVIESLHGRWLQPNTGTRIPASLFAGSSFAPVVVDGTDLGGLSELYRLFSENIETLRYFSSRDAAIKYSTSYPGGVIEVSTRGLGR